MVIFIIINNTDIVQVIVITCISISRAENFSDIISCNSVNLKEFIATSLQ